MAAKLLMDDRRDVITTPIQPLKGSGPPPCRQTGKAKSRFVAVLLFLLTVAAVVFAGFNFDAELKSAVPDDGVWWVEHGGRLTADRVDPSGPGARSGIKTGDQLVSINGQEVQNISGLEQQLYRNGVWSKAAYSLVRQSVALDSSVILIPAERSLNNWLRLIALIYLWYWTVCPAAPRWTAPGSPTFISSAWCHLLLTPSRYTGKLNDFDWTILLGQHHSRSIAAVPLPSFRFGDLPGETPGCAASILAAGAGLCAGSDPADDPHRRHALAASK